MSTAADEIWAILRESAEAQKITDRKFQDTHREFQEIRKLFQETDRQMKETDRKVKEVSRDIGRLGNRLGEFIEDALRPAVVRMFQQRGIAVYEVHQNISS